MDEFYLYVSIAAVIILILSLAAFGVTMYKVKQLDVFPPFQNSCPDYWDISGNTCGFPNQANGAVNTGDVSVLEIEDCSGSTGKNCIKVSAGSKTAGTNALSVTRHTDINKSFIELSGTGADSKFEKLFPGRSARCAKKRWAELTGIAWDGISNYNGC